MIELLSLTFMQRALIGGVLVAILSGYYGIFVVQRGLSFMGSGLAHAAFGGIALGLFLETEPLWISVPFTAVVAMGIVWLKEKTELGGDTVIGIFFAVSMALGIVFLYLRRAYSADAFTYLFGSILAVSWTDIYIATGLVTITAFVAPRWKNWAYASFDRELAETDHVPVLTDDYILSVLVAMTVVVSIKIVGIVLIAAFLVIPAAGARLLSKTFRSMTVFSILIGILSAVAGLFLSYFLDLPSGATITLFQASIFMLCMLFRTSQRIK